MRFQKIIPLMLILGFLSSASLYPMRSRVYSEDKEAFLRDWKTLEVANAARGAFLKNKEWKLYFVATISLLDQIKELKAEYDSRLFQEYDLNLQSRFKIAEKAREHMEGWKKFKARDFLLDINRFKYYSKMRGKLDDFYYIIKHQKMISRIEQERLAGRFLSFYSAIKDLSSKYEWNMKELIKMVSFVEKVKRSMFIEEKVPLSEILQIKYK